MRNKFLPQHSSRHNPTRVTKPSSRGSSGKGSLLTCQLAALASDWLIEGRLISIDEEIARIEQLTTADVMRILCRFPMREKQVLTTLGPLSEKELL